jgi:hypothetical protein
MCQAKMLTSSGLEESQALFRRVQEVLQHIFESRPFDFLVEALELPLRRVAFLLLLIVLRLLVSHGSLVRLPVNATVFSLFIFFLFVVAFPLLSAVLCLVSVLALDTLDLPLDAFSFRQRAMVDGFQIQLG